MMTFASVARRALSLLSVGCTLSPVLAQVSPDAYRGLWVGQVTLRYATEVSVPLDEENIAIAPNPNVPTPTADAANLRLILHVNGAGQTSLLRDVAILNRKGGGDDLTSGLPVNLVTNLSALNTVRARAESDNDLALVSDERLYGDFPPQPAARIASAVFDFGDRRATMAVDEVLEAAVQTALEQVQANATEAAASTAAQTAAQNVISKADAAASFSRFLTDNFDSGVVDAIAAGGSTNTAWQAAVFLRTNSFYGDSRGMELISNIVVTVAAHGTLEQKRQRAQNLAASYADLDNQYQRFIAGQVFGDMIPAAARAAAAEVTTNSAPSEATIRAVVNGRPEVIAAREEALRRKVAQYDDVRATTAVDVVLDALVESAVASVGVPGGSQGAIESAAAAAARLALTTEVTRYPLSAQNPTADYTAFIRSVGFQASAAAVAAAAVQGARSEQLGNALWTDASVIGAARVRAAQALREVYSAAARAAQTELPLTGRFGPGEGDARLTWDVVNGTNAPPLGPGALAGTIVLPASAPTNPFRHRRHPDHVIGFDIERRIRLDFDGNPTNVLARSGFGVDRITGVFREEIFGLHKPLGPEKDKGLKVEGHFELNRVSLIDTLNAR